MMMKIIESGGVSVLTDGERQADSDNPNGYYEFERVKQLKYGDVAWIPGARGKAVKIISALLPMLPDDHAYKIIFMRRKINEILASQRKMLINRGEDPDAVDEDEMRTLFEKHLLKIERWLENRPNVDYITIDYNRLLSDPRPCLNQIDSFLGNRLALDPMAAVIDPGLYRQRD
jgi:hypothetical protein